MKGKILGDRGSGFSFWRLEKKKKRSSWRRRREWGVGTGEANTWPTGKEKTW